MVERQLVGQETEPTASDGSGGALWAAFDGFLSDRLAPDDSVLEEIRQRSARAGLPDLAITGNQAALLALLLRLGEARRVLEVGALGGYSTVCLARELPDGGRLVTVGADGRCVEVARESITAAGLDGRVEVRAGDAELELARMMAAGEDPFDLVFLDVDERANAVLYPVARRLVRPGGLVVAGAADLVRGTRALLAAVAAGPGDRATAVQTVGSEGRNGFVIVQVAPAGAP